MQTRKLQSSNSIKKKPAFHPFMHVFLLDPSLQPIWFPFRRSQKIRVLRTQLVLEDSRVQMASSANIPTSLGPLPPTVRNQRTAGPLSSAPQGSCCHLLSPPWKTRSKWHNKLYLLHSRAALSFSSKLFHILTTNPFQRPASSMMRLTTATVHSCVLLL